MAAVNTSKSNGGINDKNMKRKKRYLPQNKPVRKGSYPLRPGVQGFFITCDGGRESQASREAINLLDNFFEELLHGKDSGVKHATAPSKPSNKIIKFADSDSSDSDDDCGPHTEDVDHENKEEETGDTPSKKRRIETGTSECENSVSNAVENSSPEKQVLDNNKLESGNADSKRTEEKSIDKQIEAELHELGDRNKRHFVSLDSGCNGVIFIQMHQRSGNPGPFEIVQHMMVSAATTRKHMSRFILRMLPVEVTCYASEEEISKAIKPLIAQYFPTETQTPIKFAVLFEARANTGIDRMKIINLVAKSVPEPHKVDLNNPDKTIIVQVAKTICMVGVAERYKELSKFNLRQLTSPKP
ncbi:THUMP domain-containing protein 1 [Cinnamomum micranthum f. kanehirae]|uniref:THUMP domain-containing protein 1 n=1 Tax=Cinnamomum micranthum f. kanehirae TaxID=337451 RepID=A0A3S3NB25_9MAGN|nr:THUMP domain-containing protein 1 [Cinnamomum micranthum f. kanehirae]